MTQQSIAINDARAVLKNAARLFNRREVERAIDAMAESIHARLSNENPLLLPVMIGGVVLTGMLLPRLRFPLQLDYIHATRYRGQTRGDELRWLKKPQQPLADKTLLLIDDILDHGITLAAIKDYCAAAGAKKVFTAVLVEKKLEQDKPLPHADFTGLTIADHYVFGYGMDYREYHRNLDGIYALNKP